MDCIPIGSLSPALITMSVSLPESLVTLKFQATRTVGGTASWEDFAEYSVFDGFPYQFAAPPPDALPAGLEYPLRFVGIGEGGRIYTSNELTAPLQCGDEGEGGGRKPPSGDAPCDETTLGIRYSGEIAPCNSVNDGTATIAVGYCPLDEPKVLPDKVKYYLKNNGEWRLLKQFTPAIDGWGKVTVETAGFPEGKYQVRVDLVYGESVIEGFRWNTLTVERTLPAAQIICPDHSAPFFTRRVVNDRGEVFDYTNIKGIAGDENGISGYSMSFGQGPAPGEWFDIPKGIPCSSSRSNWALHSTSRNRCLKRSMNGLLPLLASRSARASGFSLASNNAHGAKIVSDTPTPAQPAITTPATAAPPIIAAPAQITIDEFMKIQLKTAKVLSAERVPKSEKLLKLQVLSAASSGRSLPASARNHEPEALVGKTIIVVANLKPAKLMGIESQWMVLAAGDSEVHGLATILEEVDPGTKVK